jgi:hypothetical protein
MAPSSNWNVFRLDDYRQGLQEESAVTVLPMTLDLQPNLCSVSLAFDLRTILPDPGAAIELSVTTVIAPQQGENSYWAITHCGKEADFHLRESFAIHI